jgi:hypothetical protein
VDQPQLANAYPELEREAMAFPAPTLLTWLAENRKMVFDLVAKRAAFPNHPRSTGAVETLLGGVKGVITDRVHLFRNADRLDRLLSLIAAQVAGKASEERYAEILRD